MSPRATPPTSGVVNPRARALIRALEPRLPNLSRLEPRVPEGMRAAAVLVLFTGPETDAAEQDLESSRLVLIQRAGTMRHHAHQIAFPGGKWEPRDHDLAATAMREAWEELAIEPENVALVGRLPTVMTPSGFVITPCVGVDLRASSSTPVPPDPDGGEVERVIMPSYAQLRDPDNYRRPGVWQWRGQEVPRHEYHVCDPPVWGATGRIVWDLLGRVGALGD